MIPYHRRARALLTRRGRKKYGQFLIEGVRLAEEALAAGVPLHIVYHLPAEPDTRLAHLLDEAKRRGILLVEVSPDELDEMSQTQAPQGVVAIADIPRWGENDLRAGQGGDLLVLEDVRDPGNVGTLLRTAEAAGARGVLALRGTAEYTNPKVVRAAMGALFRLPVVQVSSPEEAMQICRAMGLPIVATIPRGGRSVSAMQKIASAALVLGGEAEGISPVWEENADLLVHIPMRGRAESLNVAIAGGILLFRHIWRG